MNPEWIYITKELSGFVCGPDPSGRSPGGGCLGTAAPLPEKTCSTCETEGRRVFGRSWMVYMNYITWKWNMAPWKTIFLYKQGVFHFHVSSRECIVFWSYTIPILSHIHKRNETQRDDVIFQSRRYRIPIPSSGLLAAWQPVFAWPAACSCWLATEQVPTNFEHF